MNLLKTILTGIFLIFCACLGLILLGGSMGFVIGLVIGIIIYCCTTLDDYPTLD